MNDDSEPIDLSLKRWNKYYNEIKNDEIENNEKNNEKNEEKNESEDENEIDENIPENDRTIYIGNLPFDAKDDELIDIFKNYGKIVDYKLPKYQDSGRMLGYGYIIYNNIKSVENAIADNGLLMKKYNRELVIGKPIHKRKIGDINKVKPRPYGCKTVFVKNIPYKITEEEVKNVFQYFIIII